MKQLSQILREALNEDIDLQNYFGYVHKFINITWETPEEYAKTHPGYSEPTIIDGAPEPPTGCSLMVHYNSESGGKFMSPKANNERKSNKDILLNLPTVGKTNSFRSLGGYNSDVVSVATLMILAPQDSSEDDFEKILNSYTKGGKNITVQQFIGSHEFSIDGWGGPKRDALVYRIFVNKEYAFNVVFEV